MFDWVHTNFHYNPLKDRNASRKTNTKSMTREVKRRGLSKQADEIVDVLDDWSMNGRRLTIFLMGFEKSSNFRNIYKAEYFNLRKEGKRCEFVDDNNVDDDDEDEDEDELSPLMATTFHNNSDDNDELYCNNEFDKAQVAVNIERHVVAQRLGRRVTLADLFMADADGNPAPEIVVVQDSQKKLPKVETDADKSKVAAPAPAPARPHARNLRRVMKKMMKRKIHAEVEQQQLLG